ncbi:alpha-mannosidase [Aestuariibius sp. 2305UL40-4]|uniref:alpha-mannosidase n=1 Tax=Aestuariibius violaceus TaxID=3234132 RepID=UPI00345E94BF
MSHARRFTARKIAKRIDLIRRMQVRQRKPIQPFRWIALEDADEEPPIGADPSGWQTIPWNSYWGGQDTNFFLSSEMTIPAGWADGPIALHLPMGEAGDIFTHPEALLYIDGAPYASADRYHHTIYLPDGLADGRRHRIELHGWTGLTGWPPNPADQTRLFMGECSTVEIDLPTRDFVSLAEVVLELAETMDHDRPERHDILTALDIAFLALDTRDPLGDAFWRSVVPATAALEGCLEKAGKPLDVVLHAIGHAHMDIAYLWPISQIRRKNARSYSNVLRMMDKYPEYLFSHSQPQLYAYTEEDYPEIFDAIRARVAEGRWEIMGGMWVEPDTNIPGGEALVRQFLLGRRYFRERFGDVETPVLWLPDTFGLSWCLPQLIKQAGLKWMVTSKTSWNQYNQIPASTTWWQGIDGTRVLTHFLTTPREVQHLPFPTNYKSDLTADEVVGTWQASTMKESVRHLPICYGYGDGGGGPTGELIRRARAWAGLPGAPEVRFSSIRACLQAIEEAKPKLPVWWDELYLEGHRGVLTSQGWIKRANRKAEVALHEVEFLLAVSGAETPDGALRQAWEKLCLNQFHDILPGTSVGEVFDDARRDYHEISRVSDDLRQAALDRMEQGGVSIVNPSPFEGGRVVSLDDKPAGVPAQGADGSWLIWMPDVAPYSVTPLDRAEEPPAGLCIFRDDKDLILENALIRIVIDGDGDLISIFDKEVGREVIPVGERGNRLQVFEDRPLSWDAWDIDSFFEDRGEIIRGLTRLEIITEGPIQVSALIERSYRSSTIRQKICLHAHSKRLDFETEVDWHETHHLLKAAFPVAVFARQATYEIQWGSIQRPTHRNTSWDYAKFEVPAQKWADLSEGHYGVALLNDCKYGYDVTDNVLRLTLIKSATMPDPKADQGRHVFTYALLPHKGDWRGEVLREAYDLNLPARVVPVQGDGLALARTNAENIIVETVKPSEDGDGVILRLFEAHGARGATRVTFGKPVASAAISDLLELKELGALDLIDNSVALYFTPFQILTLRVRFH